jgi:hypothetical protein
MKYFFPLLLFFSACSNIHGPFRFTGNISNDVNQMLKEGRYRAEVMDSLVQSPEQRALEMIFKENIRENYTWYTHYLDSFPGANPLPYHPNFGLTEAQYNDLIRFRKNVILASSQTGELIIKNQNEMISFMANGKMSPLENIRIDLRNNTVIYGNFILNFSDTIHITNENHGLKSTWDGYSWRFSDPANMDMEAVRNTENLTAKHYKLTVGHLNKTGKTLISFTAREMINGEFMTDIDIPVVF